MEIPFDENTNWGQMEDVEEGGWGDVGSYDPNEGGWGDIGTKNEPILIGETYILLTEAREKPFLCKVESINEKDKIVELSDKQDKKILVNLDTTGCFIMSSDDYKLIEYIKVKEYTLDLDQYEKEKGDIEFEVLVKGEYEKQYSELLQVDDLLSQLIQSFDCYDNYHKINKIHDIANIFLSLIHHVNEIKEERIANQWLIPIIDNEIQYYYDEGIQSIKDSIELSTNVGDTNYSSIINDDTKYCNPFIVKEGEGYNTDEYIGNVLRECTLKSSCVGINGDYNYDERKTRDPLLIPQEKKNKDNNYYNELTMVLSSDNINIIGYFEESFRKLYYQTSGNLFHRFKINEKIVFDELWSSFQTRKSFHFQNMSIINHLSLEDSIKPEPSEYNIAYNFSEKLNKEKLKKILQKNTKDENDIVELLIKDDLINKKIMNYNDIYDLLFKYEIDYKNLNSVTKKKIDVLLSDNISENILNYKSQYKREFKPIKIRKKPLTNEKRVSLAQDYIFSILSEFKKNELLRNFIDKFTRSSDKKTEDKNWLYNKYTNKKLLCKHYLYSINSNNSNDVFRTMKTIYGRPPQNGKIYCKICNECLCDEEFSTLEGFSDDKPMQSNEVLQTNENDSMKEKLEEKDELVSLISLFSNMIGVTLTDKDTYDILLSFENLNHNILADERYQLVGVTNTDIHPRINKLLLENKKLEKKEKDKKKKSQLKKKRSEIMSQFQSWIKDTNRLLILLSLVSLFIQTAVPVYNIRRDIQLKVIDSKNKINTKGVQFIIAKVKSLAKKYSDDKLFKHCKYLIYEEEGENFEEQFQRTLSYCLGTSFPQIIERKTNYELFIESEKKKFIRKEWVTFKPLSTTELVTSINTYLESIHQDKFLKRMYGGPLIENISLIRPINITQNLLTILDISSLKILQNSSFRSLFRYVVSCYGVHKNSLFINLLTQNLIETIDQKEELLSLLKENGWKEDTQSFHKLNFKELRTKLIPGIFQLYSKENSEIESCFDSKDHCNTYIHSAVNNYDLHQLNTRPKRIYGYIPPVIFPNVSLKDMNKEHVNKLFSKYLQDEEGNIIIYHNNQNYLNQYLIQNIPFDDEIERINEGTQITKNEENFQLLLQKKQENCLLKYNSIFQPIDNYNEEDYSSIRKLSYTDTRLLTYLTTKIEEIDEPDSLSEVIRKLPNALSSPSEPPLDYDSISFVHRETLHRYINLLMEDKKELQMKQSFDQIFSEYMKIYKNDLMNISQFLSESNSITNDQKQRFEKIFSQKKISFSTENISKILNIFINSDLVYEDILNYIHNIQDIIVNINHDNIPREGTFMSNKIPKEWKLTDSVQKQFQKFIEKDSDDENIQSKLLLHNRIFSQPKNDHYLGFNHYKTITPNYHIHLRNLYNYISGEFENLELLKGDQNSLYDEKYSTIYSKFHLIKVFSKMVNYIEGLRLNQTDIVNDAMELYRSLEDRNEELLEESIHICSLFVMDLLTHILFSHFDPRWLFMNKNKEDLNSRLSIKIEREKEERVQKIHNVSREDRLLMMYQQENGQSNWHKEAAESYGKFVNHEDYAKLTESERNERIQQIFSESNISLEEVDINTLNIMQNIPEQESEEREEEGLYNENVELNEDHEEYIDDYDEEQEVEFNV